MTEKQLDFTMDPNLLVSVIKTQAGTLSKALLEGVMNSIDAGASRVDITVTKTGFTISDNGRGFESEAQIKELFGRFGTPHTEGDALYGRFRMGRGQLMAFAKTCWRSGDFQMEVDIEADGLTYKLSRLETPVKGCVIEGTLYNKLEDWRFTDQLSELKKFVAYTPKPVYVNGELYGACPSRLSSWTYEDEYAYYRLIQGAETLLVYNLGVFVEEMSTWRVGRGGIVVSKQALKVNFARNSVMEETCPVWRRIQSRLQDLVFKRMLGAKSLQPSERKFLARRIRDLQDLAWLDWRQAKLLTDPSGRHLPLKDLGRFKHFVYIEDCPTLARSVHGTDDTFVVTGETLDRFGVSTLDDWLTQMSRYGLIERHQIEVLDVASVRQLGMGGARVLEEGGLTKKEAAAFSTLVRLNRLLGDRLIECGVASAIREMRVGVHKRTAYKAWTDGKAYITANRRFLKDMHRGLDGVHGWLLTLCHEYCHDTDDSESHAHGEVFYTKFHDLVFQEALQLSTLSRIGLKEYLHQLHLRGVPRPRKLSKQLKG